MVSLIQWFPSHVSSSCPFHPPACSLWSSCAWNDSFIKKPSFQIIPPQIITLVLQFSRLLRFPFILNKLLLVLFPHINQIFSNYFPVYTVPQKDNPVESALPYSHKLFFTLSSHLIHVVVTAEFAATQKYCSVSLQCIFYLSRFNLKTENREKH